MECTVCNNECRVHKYYHSDDDGNRNVLYDPDNLPTRFAVRNKVKVAYFCSPKCSLDWYTNGNNT